MNRVFVGYDSEQELPYRVLKYSIEKHGSRRLNVRPLVLREMEERHGFRRPHDPLASTEFTYTRFLVPYLCGYKGTALFIDSDMLALGDLNEVFELPMDRYWLRVVKHNHRPTSATKMDGRPQTQYPRKNWSSMMLMNCEKLTTWTREAVETQSGAWLHRFQTIPNEYIGDIPQQWNVLDEVRPDTKLIHYTHGGPWFEECKDHPYGAIWFQYRDEYVASRRHAWAQARRRSPRGSTASGAA